ncbi:MAG: glutathione S-transferase family protein [Methyloligellaceae bacterium]
MTLILHTISGAPRGWRVLLGMSFKGLSPEIHYLNYSEKEHQQPDFLKLNPRATIPTLETDSGILRDSIAILAWLDREYPENPLFGSTSKETATIWQITMECCDYLRDSTDQLLSLVFRSSGNVPAENSSERLKYDAAAELAHAECRYLENILSDTGPYLSGDRPGAADAIAFPEIRLMQRAVETRHELMSALGFGYPPDIYPKVAEWKARLNDDPGVAATMPPHWSKT